MTNKQRITTIEEVRAKLARAEAKYEVARARKEKREIIAARAARAAEEARRAAHELSEQCGSIRGHIDTMEREGYVGYTTERAEGWEYLNFIKKEAL